MPGPGSYLNEENLNHMVKKTESISKKGLGNGFISQSDRFSNKNALNSSKFHYIPGAASTYS